MLTHMDVYFESFWYIPCQGILHPATTYRLIEEDKLSPHLAAAVVSLTATVVGSFPATYLPPTSRDADSSIESIHPPPLVASTATDLFLLPSQRSSPTCRMGAFSPPSVMNMSNST